MNLPKKQLIIIALLVALSGIVGFYGGRYYEQRTFRKRFQNMMQNRNFGGGNQTSGSQQRQRGQFRQDFNAPMMRP